MGFLPSDVLKNISRDRAVVAYKAHNLGVGGSNPPPATSRPSKGPFRLCVNGLAGPGSTKKKFDEVLDKIETLIIL